MVVFFVAMAKRAHYVHNDAGWLGDGWLDPGDKHDVVTPHTKALADPDQSALFLELKCLTDKNNSLMYIENVSFFTMYWQ